ncbi:MAG: GrpB family protein [Bacteroidia bacterium]|nr:GrpB family protein [Bacteroidia bacterium]
MPPLIEPYNPQWKTEFDSLRGVLRHVLDGIDLDIQHVGSTAVPGLCAKPILDIDIIIQDKTLLDPISARLEKTGYLSKGDQGIPGRFAFRQISARTPQTDDRQQWQEHHLYLCFSDSLALHNHLLFRDALLGNPQLVMAYAQLKMKLIHDPHITRATYTKHKTDFIVSVLADMGLSAQDLRAITDANT